MRTQRALSTSTLAMSMQPAICEHVDSAGIWIWANLVSPRCVMVQLSWKHVERLAILSAGNRFRLAPCSPGKGLGRVAGPRRLLRSCHLRPTTPRTFGGIWTPPLGTPSEARDTCSSLIGKPRRFEWCTEPAGLRSGHCAISRARRSFLHL